MPVIYGKRAIYQGEKQIPVIKVNEKRHIDPDVIRIFLEWPEPGSYIRNHRHYKDILIKDLDDYFSLGYFGIYKGEKFQLDSVNYNTRETRITTGDNYGERCEELKQIGVEGQYYDRGMIYHKVLPPESLDKIIRTRYCYFTNQSEESEISVDQFWSDVLEARTYLEPETIIKGGAT